MRVLPGPASFASAEDLPILDQLIKNGHAEIGFVGNVHAASSILDRYLGYFGRCCRTA